MITSQTLNEFRSGLLEDVLLLSVERPEAYNASEIAFKCALGEVSREEQKLAVDASFVILFVETIYTEQGKNLSIMLPCVKTLWVLDLSSEEFSETFDKVYDTVPESVEEETKPVVEAMFADIRAKKEALLTVYSKIKQETIEQFGEYAAISQGA